MRFRTTATDNNGTPQTATGVGTLTTNLTHVVYTRDATGAVTIYLDGVPVQTGFTGGTCANWNTGYAFALGNELTEDRPKVMLSIGGKPLLRRLVDEFKKQSINRITVVAGYKADAVDISGINICINDNYEYSSELSSAFCGYLLRLRPVISCPQPTRPG